MVLDSSVMLMLPGLASSRGYVSGTSERFPAGPRWLPTTTAMAARDIPPAKRQERTMRSPLAARIHIRSHSLFSAHDSAWMTSARAPTRRAATAITRSTYQAKRGPSTFLAGPRCPPRGARSPTSSSPGPCAGTSAPALSPRRRWPSRWPMPRTAHECSRCPMTVTEAQALHACVVHLGESVVALDQARDAALLAGLDTTGAVSIELALHVVRGLLADAGQGVTAPRLPGPTSPRIRPRRSQRRWYALGHARSGGGPRRRSLEAN